MLGIGIKEFEYTKVLACLHQWIFCTTLSQQTSGAREDENRVSEDGTQYDDDEEREREREPAETHKSNLANDSQRRAKAGVESFLSARC